MKSFQRLITFGTLILVLFSVVMAIAATNTVPATLLDYKALSLDMSNFKPSACAGISVTNLVIGTGTITGTAANDLILGGSGADLIDSSAGNDCILGGGGDDQITGGDGSDVCLGGPGTDAFTACETERQ